MIRNIANSSLATIAFLGIFAVSQDVVAAELVQLEGKVSVNRGDGFEPAKQGMVLKPGDQVLVGKESAASLVYAEPGCVFDIAEASVVTVSDVGPCIPGQTVVEGKGALVTPTQAMSQDRNYCDHDDNANDDDNNQCLPFYIMGGGAIIGSAAFMIYEAGKGNESSGQPPSAPGFPGPCDGVSCP